MTADAGSAALWQFLFPRRRRAQLILDDENESFEDEFMLIVACNTIFSGSGMRLAPRAKVDDGKIDVVVVRDATRRQMLRLFAGVCDGSHADMPWVDYYQARSVSIFADDHEPLDFDGEIKSTTPVPIRMIPGAVQFFI